MRLGFKIFLLLFLINFTRYSCEHVSIIGSHLISTDLNYTALLQANHVNSTSNVAVTLVEDYILNGFEENVVEALVFETAKNIHHTKPQASVKVYGPGLCKEQSVDLINTAKSPIVFIQFDKPIYKAGELFKAHIFVLDRKMLPLKGPRKISAYITDANDNKIDISLTENREFGVYEATRIIPQGVTSGLYNINVEVNRRKVSKSFEVQEQLESDDEVFIEMQDTVAFVDRKIYLILHTKEPSGRSAKISLAAKFENASIDEINMPVRSQDLKSTKTVFQLDIQEDLTIRFPTADMILKFTVQVIRAATGKKTTVEKEIRMRYKGRNTIQILRKKFFKPGHKYSVKARVKTLDGKPDNSLNHLSTTITLVTKNNKTEEKVYQTNLKKGETIYNLQPKADTEKILISMEIADTKYSEEVFRFPGADDYMLVSVLTKSPQVGSKVQIKVESTEEMEELHLVVFGTSGIVLHESFPDAIQKDVYEINMVVTNEMKPEARGLVFYSRLRDGALIYDEFSIGLGFSIENSLEITADATAEPDTTVDIQVKTEEGSLVYLVAINANSPQITRDNEVSRSAIYDEIIYFLNEKYSMSPEHHFEKLNAFILEPLKSGTDCLRPRSNFGNENEGEKPRTKRSITSIQKLYPEILPDVKYIANTSEAQKVQLKIPDFTAKWRIFGISVHPTKGFTVAKTQPEISVKGILKHKLELDLAGQASIKQDEMHKITLTAVNVNPTEIKGTVIVTAEDGHLYEDKQVNYNNKKCINEYKETRLQFPIHLTPQENSMSGTFYISSESNNQKQIKLKATFDGEITAEEFKLIDVEDSKESKTIVLDTKLIESTKESAEFNLIGLPDNTSSYKTIAGIHGNLLGPALEGLDKIFGQVMYLEEEKILKFATDVIICKYFYYIGKFNHPKAKVAKERIAESGPEVVTILKNTPNRKKNLGKLAFITGVLIDAIGYFDASRSISETLTFFKSEQYYYQSTGKFDYYPEFDNYKDISPTVRKYIQIASIAATMAKNSQYKQTYSNEIGYSLNYLIKHSNEKQNNYTGDHLNSMTAYAFALIGNHQKAAFFLQKLNHGYKSIRRHLKHYSMYVQALSYIIFTKTLINQDPKEQVEWLLKYRNAAGAFFSPYDTVLALQALYEYTRYRDFIAKNIQRQYIIRTDINDTYIKPSESAVVTIPDKNIKVQTFNLDLGYMTLYQEYFNHTNSRNLISSVETLVKKGRIINSLEIEVEYAFRTLDRELGNSIIVLEVDLPVGYKHHNPNNEVVGYRNNGATLVFHFNNKVKNTKYIKLITVVKDPNVESYYKPLIIKFYDYYRPNIQDIYNYNAKCVFDN